MFKVIEDEAKKSGVRITSIFEKSLKNRKFHFSDSFNRDMKSLNEYFNQIQSGISQADAFKNTMAKASMSAKEFAKSQNITSASIVDFVNKQKASELGLIAQNHSLVTCNALIKEYASGLKHCGMNTDDFISGIEDGNPVLANYLKGLNGGKATLRGYIKALASAKASTIALTAVTTVLNTAISTILMAGFQRLLTKIDEHIRREEIARDKISELAQSASDSAQSYKDTASAIGEYSKQVHDLREEIDSGNLSEQEAYEKRQQLISIQDDLIQKFGGEAASINLVTGEITKQIAEIERLGKVSANQWLASESEAIYSMKEVYSKTVDDTWSSFFDKDHDNTAYLLLLNSAFDALSPEDVEKFSDHWEKGGFSTSFKADSYEEAIDVLTEFNRKLQQTEEYKADPNKYKAITTRNSDLIKEYQAILDEQKAVRETYISATLEADAEYTSLWERINEARSKYNEAIASGKEKDIYDSISAMHSIEDAFRNADFSDDIVNDYLSDYFDAFTKEAEGYQLQIDVQANLDTNESQEKKLKDSLQKFIGKTGKIDLTKIKNAQIDYDSILDRTNNPQAFSDAQLAYANLKAVADEYEVEVEDLVNALVALGEIQLEVSETGDGTYDSTEKIISNYREIVTALRQAVTEYNANGYITVDTYNSLAKHGEDYADLCVHTAEGIKLQSDEVATLTEELNQTTGAELAAANASDATIRSTLALASSLLKTSSSTDASLDAISDLVDIQTELKEGTQYSSTEIMELVEQYPQLAGHVEELTKGYGFEADAVRELVAELTELYKKNELLKTQSARTSLATAYNGRYALTADNVDKTFENFASANDGKQITSREDYIIQWKIDFPDRTDEDAEKIASEVWDYVDARIEANVKGEIADKVATGNAQPGYTPTKSDKDEETEFERQYKLHNHLLNMDKESVEDYLAWLRVAYIASYNAGEMELDDFYKYKEEVYEKEKELFEDSLTDTEHQISLLENATADNNDKIVALYEDMQRRVHAKAEEYRAAGLDDNHELIQELQNQWWSYEQEIEKIRENEFDTDIDEINFGIETLKLNGADSEEILSSYQSIYQRITSEIEYYTSKGYSATSEKIRELTGDLRDTKEEIIDYLNEIVDEANELVDGVQDAYTTLTDAAKEYASTGALSVDSLQSIFELGPKYLSFLYDENGQLTVNKEAIQKVVAARTEELAAETALAYAKQILQAAQDNDINSLIKLTDVTIAGTNATWDMAYATLGLARAIGEMKGMDAGYFDEAADNLAKMQSVTKTAVSTISTYYATLEDGYVSQEEGLNTILELTQDMIKWENEQLIDALEQEKEDYSDIIDQKKELIRLAKEQADRESSVAEKLEEAAKLQAQIAQLSLDDSREAQAQRRSLEEELAKLQKELSDEQADHSFEVQEEALDKELEAFEQSKDDEIEALEDMLSSTEKLYQAAIDRISNDWNGLYSDLLDWNYEYGSTLESDLVAAWEAASAAVQKYGSYVEAVEGVKNNTILGEHTESSGGSKNESYTSGYESYSANADNLINRMRQNSIDWFTASDRKAVEKDQQALADEWYNTFGERLISKNGSWYRPGESDPLYTLTDDEVGTAVVSKMEANAQAWHTASESEKARLAAENEELARLLENFLKKKIYKTESGVWKLGERDLFDVYHKGGVVGGHETLKDKEVLAKLKEDELVLTEDMRENLIKLFDTPIELESDRRFREIGVNPNVVNQMAVDNYSRYAVQFEDRMQRVIENAGNQANAKTEQKIEIGDIYAPMQVVQKLDEEEIKKHAKQIGEISAGHIREAFTKLGIKRTASLM